MVHDRRDRPRVAPGVVVDGRADGGTGTPDVIVLHGAWHRPEHWEAVVARLRQRGRSVEVPDLHGLSLPDARLLVQPLIARSERPPLVVAHSSGGILAGTLEGAGTTAHLMAYVLDVGESPQSVIEETALREGRDISLVPVVPDESGHLALDLAGGARAAMYADVDEQTTARAVELLRPEPPTIFDAAPDAATWCGAGAVYVAGRDDRTVDPALTARFTAHFDDVRVWPTGHSPYLSHPDLVVDLVEQLTTAPRPR